MFYSVNPAAAFPQVGRAIEINPENCGFDSPERILLGGLPAAPGFWSGPVCTVTEVVDDIYPRDGRGMLRFLASPNPAGQSPAAPRSEVWYVMDLRPHKELIAVGGNGKLSAVFNRTRGAQGKDRFGLTLAGFRGRPEEAAELWPRRSMLALGSAEQELIPDSDPTTSRSCCRQQFAVVRDFMMQKLHDVNNIDKNTTCSIFVVWVLKSQFRRLVSMFQPVSRTKRSQLSCN